MSLPVIEFRAEADRPMRKAVRRLRWFRSTFDRQVDAIAAEYGIDWRSDNTALAACFFDWLRVFEAQKPAGSVGRRAYVSFAAGLMLERLIRFRPLEAVALPADVDRDNPAYFWPEGFAYVAYCINIRSAVLRQDFNEKADVAPALREIRAWWSFRENTCEDPTMAIAFLDLFCARPPNWSSPAIFNPRLAEVLPPPLDLTPGGGTAAP